MEVNYERKAFTYLLTSIKKGIAFRKLQLQFDSNYSPNCDSFKFQCQVFDLMYNEGISHCFIDLINYDTRAVIEQYEFFYEFTLRDEFTNLDSLPF